MSTTTGPGRRGGAVATTALLVAGTLLTGCQDDDPDRPRVVAQATVTPVDELSAHDGRVCPAELPQQPDPGYGFGNEDAAENAPNLAAPESAWVCQYEFYDAGAGPGGNGRTVGWRLAGEPRQVPEADLDRVDSALGELTTYDEGERFCTADLGPRWMLVYAAGNDLTGVVVDDFGCGDVRLTDEPFETPPGDATQPGTVAGVLDGPSELLDVLKEIGG